MRSAPELSVPMFELHSIPGMSFDTVEEYLVNLMCSWMRKRRATFIRKKYAGLNSLVCRINYRNELRLARVFEGSSSYEVAALGHKIHQAVVFIGNDIERILDPYDNPPRLAKLITRGSVYLDGRLQYASARGG